MHDLVARSLPHQPMVLDGDVRATRRFVHVWDIGRALARLLGDGVAEPSPAAS